MKNLSLYLLVFTLISCGGSRDRSSPANFSLQFDEETNVEYLKELISDHPRNPNNYIRLAKIYTENSDHRRAIQLLREANENFPGNEEIKMMLIEAYLENDQKELAGALFDKLYVDEGSLEHFVVSAEYNFKNGQYTKALDNINRVLVLDDGNSDYYALKAKILLHIDDTIGAVSNYNEAIRKPNLRFNTTIDYLNLLIRIKSEAKFLEVYNKLPDQYKNDPRSILIFTDFLIEIGELDSAKKMIAQVENQNFEIDVINRVTKINYEQRNYDSVLYYLKDYQLESIDLLLLEARSFDRVRQYAESEKSYLAILQVDSTHAIATQELTILRRKMRYLRDLRKREENKIELIPSKPLVPKNQNN